MTAVLDLPGWHERTLGSVRFFHGQRTDGIHASGAGMLMLGELDPALLSEVAADVTRLASKGRTPS